MVQPLARKLLSLAAAFEDAAPWRKAGGATPFLIRIPGIDHPVAASIMGGADEEFGIVIFADEQGPQRMLRMAREDIDGGEAYGESLVYAFCLESSSEVVGAFRKVLKAGGYRPRPLKLTPHFMVCEPTDNWRPVKQGEARVLAHCIHATLRAFEAGALAEADELDPDEQILELTVTGDAIEAKTAPEVSWSTVPSPIAGEPPGDHRRRRETASAVEDLKVRPGTTWVFHGWPLSEGLGGFDHKPVAIAAIELEDEELVGLGVVARGDVADVAREFGAILMSAAIRPETLLVKEQWLNEAIAWDLRVHGTEVRFGPFGADLDDRLVAFGETFRDELETTLDKQLRDEDPLSDNDDVPPDPDSAAAWSGDVDEVIERLLDSVPVMDRRRAGRVYWGDEETAMNLSPQVCRLGAMSAFFDWLVIDHRAKAGSKTYAEKALARPRKWSERERIVLAALTRCELAPFSLEPAGVGAVELTGLLDGETCLAFGVNFPSSLSEPFHALMYVIRVPGHVICRIAGPLLLRAPFDELAASSPGFKGAMEAGALRGAGALIGDVWLRFAADLDEELDGLAEAAGLDPDVEIEGSVVLAQLEAVTRKHHMKWLDESLPALGGHTPRKAVEIDELRPLVVALIRAIPSFPGPGGAIDPPREELLAALGLDE